MQAHTVQAPNSNVEPYVALPMRAHTILGVCEGLGEDLGVNPIWFRIPLATAVIWNPLIAFGTYFALGAVVLASRLLFPDRRATIADAQTHPVSVQANDAANVEKEPLAA